MCVHICMYVYSYSYIHVHIYIHVYTYIHLYKGLYSSGASIYRYDQLARAVFSALAGLNKRPNALHVLLVGWTFHNTSWANS